MTAIVGILQASKSVIEDFKAYCRITVSYIQKNKPVEATAQAWITYIKNLLTANRKLKVARYRVNHLRYRLDQMEKLISANNPNNSLSGKTLNIMR